MAPKTDSEGTVTLTFEQIKELLSMNAASGTPQMQTALEAMQAMAQAQVAATSQLGDQVRRTVIRSNAEHENVSVFNFKAGCPYCDTKTRHPEDPEVVGSGKMGHPKPKLEFETYFPRQARVVWDDATVLEIELFNELGRKMQDAPHLPITARMGQWEARMSPDAKKLFVNAPSFTSDERNSLPPLALLLFELLKGGQAVDPTSALSENIELRRRIEALEARQVPA